METALADAAFVPLMKEVGAYDALAGAGGAISADVLLAKLDGDGDGMISLSEFLGVALGLGNAVVKEMDF